MFYRGTVGACLVFDITNKETFDILPEWYKTIEEGCEEGTIVTLVGNKCDLSGR